MYTRQPPAERRTRTTQGTAVLRSHALGPHPILHYFLERMHLSDIVTATLGTPYRHGLGHAKALEVLIHNIVVSPGPLYRVGEWLAPLEPHTLGLTSEELVSVNDDQLARTLDALVSERARSLFFRLALQTLEDFDLATDRVHFDTTTVTLHGAYEGSKAAPRITHGVNKDHRPDLKQLLFGLNVTSDGAVPLSHDIWSGNQSDSTVHRDNVEQLRRLLARDDFVYVADSKLCSTRNLAYIDRYGGKFVTVLPRTRREDRAFRDELRKRPVRWYRLATTGSATPGAEPDAFYSCRAPSDRSKEGYRIIWIKSATKAVHDRARREDAIAGAFADLHELSLRLNRRRLKTRGSIRTAVGRILKEYKVDPFLKVRIVARKVVETRYLRRGRPTPTSPVREIVNTVYHLHVDRNKPAIAAEARTDGVFPLITNLASQHAKRKVLEIYKYQPYVEKRFALLKSELGVAPVYLKKPQRVAGLVHVYFIAMMVAALIERSVRQGMQRENVETLPLLPEGRHTSTPTTPRILEAFRDVVWHEFERGGELVTFPLQLDDLQRTLIRLLELPDSLYA